MLFTHVNGTFVYRVAPLTGINLALFTINVDGSGLSRSTEQLVALRGGGMSIQTDQHS